MGKSFFSKETGLKMNLGKSWYSDEKNSAFQKHSSWIDREDLQTWELEVCAWICWMLWLGMPLIAIRWVKWKSINMRMTTENCQKWELSTSDRKEIFGFGISRSKKRLSRWILMHYVNGWSRIEYLTSCFWMWYMTKRIILRFFTECKWLIIIFRNNGLKGMLRRKVWSQRRQLKQIIWLTRRLDKEHTSRFTFL